MEFLFDHYKKIKDPILYLHNPDMKPISAIKARNRNFVLRFNDLSELTFEAPKYEKSKDGMMFELPYYSRLATKRLIKIDEIGWFQITQAIESEDGVTSYKSITAQSHQCAFREKGFFCEGRVYKFYDETDPYDSKYDSTKKDSIPSVVGQLYQQLGIKVAIAPTEFEPTEDYGEWTIIWVDKTLHYTNGSQQNICRSFKENSASYAYDFMVNTVENAFEVVFDFDFMHHAIKVKRVEDITQRTNIYLSFDNVVNELQTTEKADDIVTVLNCSGTDLDIRTVNPTGTNYIVDFSYYMDEVNYHWMSKELIDKLKNWKALVDSNKDMYTGLISELRDVYEAHTELSSEIIYVRKKVQDLEAVRDQFSLKTVSGDAIFQAESFDVIYDWVKPASEEVGYDIGDIVMYDGATYKSLKSKNISEPVVEPPNKSDWKLFEVRKSLDSGTSYATSHPRPGDFWHFSASQPTWNGSRFISSTVVTNTLSGIITTLADVPDIYFIDGDSKTYCKVIRGNKVDKDTGAEIQYVASIERYTTYADVSRWLTAWGKCDDTQQEAIDAYEAEAEEISASMQGIADATNILSYFKTTPSLLSELRHYWIEGDYNNDTLAVLDNTKPEEAIDLAKELLACGEKELSRVCQPRFSISVSSIKFIKIYEFRRFMYELALGKVITVEKSKDILYTPALTQMSFSLETGDDTFELVFSNALKLNDWGYTFADLIASASNTSKNVISNWNELMDYSAHKDSIQELLLNPLDTTLRLAEKNMSNQEFVVDRTGILGRKRKSEDLFEKEQVRMINNVILFTDDSWQTVKTALGKIAYTDYDAYGRPITKQAYGLLAEVLVGSFIAGNRLIITNESGSVRIDGGSIVVTNGTISSSDYDAGTGVYADSGIMISLISDDSHTPFIKTTNFSLGEDGNAYFKGDITAENLTLNVDAEIGGALHSKNFTLKSTPSKWAVEATSGMKINFGDSPYILTPYFYLDPDGVLNATGATIEGTINAIDGTIGAFRITNDGLESEYIKLNSQSIFFPTQAIFNLANDVTIYNESTVSYIATSGNRDFEIKNIGGAGIRFKANTASETVKQTITLNNFVGSEQDEDEYVGSGFACSVTCNYSISNSGVLLVPYHVTFYLKYAIQEWTLLNGWVDKTTYEKELSYDIPKGSNSGSIKFEQVHIRKNSTQKFVVKGVSINKSSYGSSVAFSSVNISATNNILYSLGSFCPNTSATSSSGYLLGDDTHVWRSVRAYTASITTSDARQKHSIEPLSESYEEFFDGLEPVSFIYEKADSNRRHVGFIAQDVEQSLLRAGISLQDFAGVCIGSDEDKTYGLRYEEFIAINTLQIQKLKARVAELEKEIKELKGEN